MKNIIKKAMIPVVVCFLCCSYKSLAITIVPLTAKGAYSYVSIELKLRGFLDAKLLSIKTPEPIFGWDTNRVKWLQDSVGNKWFGWDGLYGGWEFEFYGNQIGADSVLYVGVYIPDSASSAPVFIVDTIYKSHPTLADTLGIADGAWLDSDSIARVYWVRGFNTNSSVEVLLDRSLQKDLDSNKWSIVNCWQFTENTPPTSGRVVLDAATGRLLSLLISDVENDGVNNSSIEITPNPLSNSFTLNKMDPIHELVLCSLLGNHIRSWSDCQPNQSFDVSDLPPGMYMLRIASPGRVSSSPLVIAR